MVYLLAIGAAVLYGAADFTGGLTARRASVISVVVLSQAGGLALVALVIPLLPPTAPSPRDLWWGATAGVTGGIGVALLYRALAVGTMAVVAPTAAVCAVAIPLGVSVLVGERPAPLALAGIALGIVSIVLVSQQHTPTAPEPADRTGSPRPSHARSPGIGMAVAAGVAVGVFFLSLARTGSEAGIWPLLVARLVSVPLFAAVVIAGGRSLRMPARVAALAVVCGVMDMLANALYMLAARQGPLGIVVTLSSLYPASTVLLARAVLGERLNPWQATGVGCALAAVVLIVDGGR